jgi:hypothetical protein
VLPARKTIESPCTETISPVASKLAWFHAIPATFGSAAGRRRSSLQCFCPYLRHPPATAWKGEWHPHMPERLDEAELADWRAGRNAVYQLAALTIGTRLAAADA